MEEIFMINQLTIQSNNTMKLEKYQQEKVMLHYRLFVRFCLFKKTKQNNCCLSK